MRPLSPEEHCTLAKRRDGFDSFVREIEPVLTDFADRLGLAHPEGIAANPEAFVEPLEEFLRDQTITEEDQAWIVARLGYFIGQLLIQRMGGEWMLNENPASRFFLRYVVGRIPGLVNPSATVDPFAVAIAVVQEPPGRRLTQTLSDAEKELGEYWDALAKS